VLNAGRQVAGGLSVAVFGTLVADRAHFLTGMRTSLLIAAALVAVTTTATVAGLRTVRPGIRGSVRADGARHGGA
jgi:MFS transporter, DHA2 family, methylenomycin A resistance protein